MLLHPQILAGAILLRPMIPLVPDEPPVLKGKEVYISAGDTDPLIRREETMNLARMLQDYGAKVVLKWARTGHSLVPDELHDAREWLHRTFLEVDKSTD
jgi:phospholipase/carboxylesterase